MAERADSARGVDDAALRAGYEQLRAVVLSERPDGFRLGHGVLLTRGMVTWMQTFATLAPAMPDAERRERTTAGGGAPALASDASAGEVLSLPGADQLVAVRAQITLAHAG